MIIQKINLLNFRNYENLELNLNSNYNIFVGDNGSGKTNILESIYFCALTKSFRINKDNKMIKENEKTSKVKLSLKNKTLTAELNEKNKKFFSNNKQFKKLSDYFSEIKTVSFFPSTINLIKGSPNERRKYLNIQISQLNKEYLQKLNEYRKLLKQRNIYLKGKKIDKFYFDILTDKLIEKAIYIYKERQNYVNRINLYINKYYQKFIKEDEIFIKYKNNIKIYNDDKIRKSLKKKFKKNYEKEKKYGFTLYGPHRDNFLILLNKKDIINYGSQGKLRIALLSLKFSEIEIYKTLNKEKPIVLLDDVFSELDRNNRQILLKILGTKIQVFITTTDIDEKQIKKGTIYKIKKGNVINFKEVK